MGKYMGCSITYCTDQENEISKIFILFLGSNGEERFLFKQPFEFSRCTMRYGLLNWPIIVHMLTNYYLLVVFLPYLTKIELCVAFPPDFDIPLSIFFFRFWTMEDNPCFRQFWEIVWFCCRAHQKVNIITLMCIYSNKSACQSYNNFTFFFHQLCDDLGDKHMSVTSSMKKSKATIPHPAPGGTDQ